MIVSEQKSRFQAAIARFDAENARDPNGIELPYAQRLSDWVEKLEPAASESLKLAARCQHICRWMIPRNSYEKTRVGYLKWREALKQFHAAKAGEILREVGYPEDIITRVQRLNLKKLWPKDPEARVLEDALCLVFLEMQFEETTAKTGQDKMISILQKTWKKMTPQAREIALQLPMSSEARALVQRALAGPQETTVAGVPIGVADPINAKILAVSEDRIQGFHRDPIGEIARRSGVELPVVIERIQAMLRAGTIRRVRQTLLATNLAQGALVAWQVPQEKLDEAFDYMFQQDPFSGHVVIRSTDAETAGSNYRLWTTLKVPQGYSMTRHCKFLARQTGAEHFRLMPAKCLFALGVGHTRRRGMKPGSKADVPADVIEVTVTTLNESEWQVLEALKREFAPDEICQDLWEARAKEAGVSLETFFEVSETLQNRGVIGRFSTFLEHVKPLADGERVTRFNALFHWAVPPGREIEAGREVGRHHILTHAYWREAGPEFRNVNIMGVAHGTDKDLLLAHKAAIDEHLKEVGIPVSYTNVFWGGRSEIKPSEISPFEYRKWCKSVGLDVGMMRE